MALLGCECPCRCGEGAQQFYEEDLFRTCHNCKCWFKKESWGWNVTDYTDLTIGKLGWIKLLRDVPVEKKHELLKGKKYPILLYTPQGRGRNLFWIRGKTGYIVGVRKDEFEYTNPPIILNLRR